MSMKEELGLKTNITSLSVADNFKLFDKNGKIINLSEDDLEKIEFRIGLTAYIASYIYPTANLEDIIGFLKKIRLI